MCELTRNDPFGVLHAVVKQPFTELRLAIYQVKYLVLLRHF